MTRSEFWDVIDGARKSVQSTTDIPAYLENFLEQKPIDYVMGFAQQLYDVNRETYDGRLWAAAFVMMEFCSDEKFSDFRSWLIAQGRVVYEAALENPDTLAQLETVDGDYGQPILFKLASVPDKVYRKKLNDEIADIPLNMKKLVLLNEGAWNGDQQKPPSMFPNLYRKFRTKK